MPKIQLFEVDDGYIQYLQQFDNKVLNHYGTNYVKSRKYLGILISINNCDYVAPLSSPNPKTDYDNGVIRKSIIPIIRIVKLGKKAQLLGTIKLTSMIPVYDSTVLSYYDVNNETDIKYKNLVLDELRFIYANKNKIFHNANKLYQQKINNMSMGYIKNTVDFQLLEEKSKLYKKP
ncbi:type III toxin-antitoxin system ToxN/AbiQ family toxin [Fusobacterium simiae]|uniref:Type III toxin-antitoxin system ToxN/AbiQ family toxin n=2 Tax=Fusobacteriaceae TaxID=203492 RepID=A0ABT4DKP7_FUSSI|nr:type III toxin-antitoxin system ToxN/AbiQ family toxin [Fusobacterium simiae]MCY7009189.1 type III toxin-antitoxin system ToxN/AbiQ family toxin [Fusobacterium simiae]